MAVDWVRVNRAFDDAPFETLMHASLSEQLEPEEFTNKLAQDIAEGYLAKTLDWQCSHAKITRLFHLAYRDGGPGLSSFGWVVYAAFRLGEERYMGQPELSGAEYFATPLLVNALNKLRQTGTSDRAFSGKIHCSPGCCGAHPLRFNSLEYAAL